MPKLDLNAKRAERDARRSEPFTIALNGEEFELLPEVPVALIGVTEVPDLHTITRSLLKNPEQDEPRFLAAGPTMNDLIEIIRFYGLELGESSASTRP